ncbi:hypothetical protein BU26DRAFT_546353 [Trematosphaeria pertusa]|uniref:GAR domain-containing protein n=1 Tax=Trematosphaeria pertusa TaxID=390896 RepID=A0A6A6J4F9_9PLEO|nr:uncharacterized protein BU26DRAFT_546353 [Trematosphaeria pertusa]KAF2257257.1 hypothetical protein BU26DRAFT_546353 [Trematosphaeria pertusa]
MRRGSYVSGGFSRFRLARFVTVLCVADKHVVHVKHDASKQQQQQPQLYHSARASPLPEVLSLAPPSSCPPAASLLHTVTMSMLSSPPRFLPPISPHRAPSPTMSPGGRRGRTLGSTEEGHLRDLSPNTTLRAFTQKPMPYDTSRDEYKIFACIEALTPAERDLGARVAKAAQRLKSWCDEVAQWGWSGSFEQPSEEYKERRRKSIELRIREHVKDAELAESLPPLEYWGSLLSVEVEAHEARLDEISDELLALDVEELKEHVMDMHPSSRSRPSSAGYEASRENYKPLDDFSFLITQTLLFALPHHFQLKERLSTWTARVTVLREAPQYLDDLKTAKKAMRLGWEALDPPEDASDAAFDKWKEAVDTISGVLQGRVSDLGRRLDRMLDTLEAREDCLPDGWIDVFESVEADFGRWAHDSRKRVIEFDVRRRAEHNGVEKASGRHSAERLDAFSDPVVAPTPEDNKQLSAAAKKPEAATIPDSVEGEPRSVTALEADIPEAINQLVEPLAVESAPQEGDPEPQSPEGESVFEEGDTVVHNEIEESPSDGGDVRPHPISFAHAPVVISKEDGSDPTVDRPQTPRSRRGSVDSISSDISLLSSPPSVTEESPSVRNATNRAARAPRPALNAAMSKRRPVKSSNHLSIESAPWPPTQFSQKSPAGGDTLDRKISDILTTIPAHIRLTSGAGADAREAKSSRGVTSKSSKGYLRAKRSFSGLKSPELTLSPVKQDFDSANAASGRKSAAAMRGDNDIKVYHLTQPGKEHPIKLYIRRVGENGERVMVRVGGGWADLGEYLRSYAEHHGRRTASDGKFEILGLEVKNTELSPSRPESAMSRHDRRFSGGHQSGSPNTTPVKSAGAGIAKDEAPPPMPNFTPTPAGSNETSAPSTGSSRHSWQGNEVGLAGPNKKKLDLSNEKLEWIEGMMKQARSVSGNISHTPHQRDERAESRSESRTGTRKSQPDFGDLGKVGGTKRIFMRGGTMSEH